jgi:hypothetical protein
MLAPSARSFCRHALVSIFLDVQSGRHSPFSLGFLFVGGSCPAWGAGGSGIHPEHTGKTTTYPTD